MLRTIGYNLIQLLFVIGFAPLYAGVLSRFKENIQSKRGPSILQPYRDLWKLFHKDEVISSETTWIFRVTPYLVFVVPLFVTSLIPVLTDYPLAFAFMGDMLAGGFFLALGGFFAALAAVDTGNPYGPMGASRTRMVGFLAEPVFMIVFFTVSFVAQSTIPYIVQQKWVASPAAFFSPAHILLLIAFLMLILAEGGRIPVDNPTGHFELAMIDESKGLAEGINALIAGLILISAFAMVATRQMQGVLRFFVLQSALLAASSFLLGYSRHSIHLLALGFITVAAKVIAIPWVLKRTLPSEVYERREIKQVLNIPTSLLLALMLAIAAEFIVGPIAGISTDPVIQVNLPIGLAGVLIGGYSLVARREALPQLIGILAMENGAFFAGIAIVPELPLIAELAIAIDVVLIAVVVGVLTRTITREIGTTSPALLAELKEEPQPWR